MKYASEDLMNEHEGILFGLKILERMVSLLKESKQIVLEDIKEIIDFFKLFADKCHHGKEEGLLFPAMEKVGIQKENGPIEQMLIEHAEGRKYIAEMSESFQANSFNKSNFMNSVSNYIQLLRVHIEKENNILFPLGDMKIPMEQQAELLKLFEDHEEKVMGAGIHEKLHKTLHEFEQKYLKRE